MRPDAPAIRVFLVDGHELVRAGMAAVLRREGMTVVGWANTTDEALAELDRADCDVILVDCHMSSPTAVDLCREIAERRLRAQVVFLSAVVDETAILTALMAGARSFVPRDSDVAELTRAIRAAARSETTIDLQTAVQVGVAGFGNTRLRPVEIRILRLVVLGRTNREIAKLLGLAPNTVKSYLQELYPKLGARTRAEAAAVALRSSIL